MAKKKRAEGNVFAVPLPDGTFAYAQILITGTPAFLRINTKRVGELEQLDLSDVAFVIEVYNDAMKDWIFLGNMPLNAGQLKPLRFFRQDVIGNRHFIDIVYRDKPQKSIEASYEDCLGLECMAVWGKNNYEERLMHVFGKNDDYFDYMQPMRNPTVESELFRTLPGLSAKEKQKLIDEANRRPKIIKKPKKKTRD